MPLARHLQRIKLRLQVAWGLSEVLLLRNVLKISPDTRPAPFAHVCQLNRYITFAELVQMVSNWLFEANAESAPAARSD